jgi:hypothetical protein
MTNRLKTPFEKTRDDFEEEFCGEIVEFLIFTLQNVTGAASLKDGCKMPSVHFKASVNVATQEFSEREGRLEWVLTPEEFEEKRWGFSFEPYKIHHIKCQKRPFMELEPYMSEVANNCYRLLEYIEDGQSDGRLEALIAEYVKPVVIKDSIGEFTLNRAYSWFEGNMDLAGSKVSVMLDANEDASLPPKSFGHLKTFVRDIDRRDSEIRDVIVKEMWETAEDWLTSDGDAEVLTEDYFYNSLYLGELSISEAGDLTLYYGDKEDIFAGHAVEVLVKIGGEIASINLVG